MAQVKLNIRDELMQRIQAEAQTLNLPVNSLIASVLEQTFGEQETTKEEILQDLREAFMDAIHGRTLPAREALAQLEAEHLQNDIKPHEIRQLIAELPSGKDDENGSD